MISQERCLIVCAIWLGRGCDIAVFLRVQRRACLDGVSHVQLAKVSICCSPVTRSVYRRADVRAMLLSELQSDNLNLSTRGQDRTDVDALAALPLTRYHEACVVADRSRSLRRRNGAPLWPSASPCCDRTRAVRSGILQQGDYCERYEHQKETTDWRNRVFCAWHFTGSQAGLDSSNIIRPSTLLARTAATPLSARVTLRAAMPCTICESSSHNRVRRRVQHSLLAGNKQQASTRQDRYEACEAAESL